MLSPSGVHLLTMFGAFCGFVRNEPRSKPSLLGSFSCIAVAFSHFLSNACALSASVRWRMSVVSSAYYCEMRWRMPSIVTPLSCVSFWKSLVRGSVISKKSSGESGQPWATPAVMGKGSAR